MNEPIINYETFQISDDPLHPIWGIIYIGRYGRRKRSENRFNSHSDAANHGRSVVMQGIIL